MSKYETVVSSAISNAMENCHKANDTTVLGLVRESIRVSEKAAIKIWVESEEEDDQFLKGHIDGLRYAKDVIDAINKKISDYEKEESEKKESEKTEALAGKLPEDVFVEMVKENIMESVKNQDVTDYYYALGAAIEAIDVGEKVIRVTRYDDDSWDSYMKGLRTATGIIEKLREAITEKEVQNDNNQ